MRDGAAAAVDGAEAEGADAHGIPDGDELPLVEEEQGVRPLDLGERLGDAALGGGLGADREEVDDRLGVAGGLEDRSPGLEALAEGFEVREVAVVRDGDAPDAAVDGERLRVFTVKPPPDGFDPFYEKYLSVRGFPVVASAKVSDYALKEAAYLIDRIEEAIAAAVKHFGL